MKISKQKSVNEIEDTSHKETGDDETSLNTDLSDLEFSTISSEF